ncbi:MAG: hypothetical protein ABEJ79_05515 [Halolamina sp.]
MSRALAINVAANTSLPGFRGPVYPDGSFEYVPIPEREPVPDGATDGPWRGQRDRVPTYADLDLSFPVPAAVADRDVHLDPAFAGVHDAPTTTYGDEHGVKAGPISSLDPGDHLLFYATLSLHPGPETVGADPPEPSAFDREPAPDLPPEWGVYVVGDLVVDRLFADPEPGALTDVEREAVAGNAHLKRAAPEPAVLVGGDDDASGLLDRAVPLSTPESGADANDLVTELSNDSGKGPWWRRVLRYDAEATADLLAAVADAQP